MVNAAFLGQLQKVTLSLLLIPVIASVSIQEAFRSRSLLDIRAVALLFTTSAKVEAPQ